MSKLTLPEIQKRIESLGVLAKRIKRKRLPVLRTIARLARKNDISIGEIRGALNGSHTNGLKGRKVEPKYKNPRTGETWSGKGSPARWLAAAEKKGRKRESFLVKR